jgi:hypothetical protein
VLGFGEDQALMRLLATEPVEGMDQQDVELLAPHQFPEQGQLRPLKQFRAGMHLPIDRDHGPAPFGSIGPTPFFLGGKARVVFLPGTAHSTVDDGARCSTVPRIAATAHREKPPFRFWFSRNYHW